MEQKNRRGCIFFQNMALYALIINQIDSQNPETCCKANPQIIWFKLLSKIVRNIEIQKKKFVRDTLKGTQHIII